MTRDRTRKDTGSALLFVLWTSLLVAVLLAGATAMVQQQARSTAAQRLDSRLDAQLSSALDLVAFDLALAGRAAVRDLPRSFPVDDAVVTVDLARQQGLMDINMADEARWTALLLRAGLEPDRARQLAQRILDWRDNDTRPRSAGGEAEIYPETWPRKPANRPFVSVEELLAVRGMGPGLWSCLAPALTVFGGTPLPQDQTGLSGDLNDLTGVRVALTARVDSEGGRSRERFALAHFGASETRPFEWVVAAPETFAGLACNSEGAA
ncbi:type II secretion system protein GspK [Maricaulis sp.]|uniref:general secretion pathway protein GspK n=1 Tax=Maricaulis sp. TaxID=1486257 RepID=UPI0026063766|nr:type II secretion system protein GspK [Maricaulis sp.]